MGIPAALALVTPLRIKRRLTEEVTVNEWFDWFVRGKVGLVAYRMLSLPYKAPKSHLNSYFTPHFINLIPRLVDRSF